MLRRTCLLIATTLTAAFAANASAQPVYSYVTDASSYSANPGTSFQVHIFLKEVLGAGDTSVIASDSGLFGAGFDVQAAPSQTNAATLTAITGDSNNFSGGFVADSANTSSNERGDNIIFASSTTGPVPTMGLISIGYVTISPSSVAGTTTQFRLGAYQPGSNGYTDTVKTFYNLDTTNTSPAYTGTAGTLANPVAYDTIFSVTSVAPEPVSSAAVVAGLALLKLRPSRKRIASSPLVAQAGCLVPTAKSKQRFRVEPVSNVNAMVDQDRRTARAAATCSVCTRRSVCWMSYAAMPIRPPIICSNCISLRSSTPSASAIFAIAASHSLASAGVVGSGSCKL